MGDASRSVRRLGAGLALFTITLATSTCALFGIGGDPDGASCEDDADCSGGICEAGMCTTECECDDTCGEEGPSDDCEEGWVCSDADGVFQSIHHCEPTCETDADCPEGRPRCNVDRCY